MFISDSPAVHRWMLMDLVLFFFTGWFLTMLPPFKDTETQVKLAHVFRGWTVAAGPRQSNLSEKNNTKRRNGCFFFSQGTWTLGTEADEKTLPLAVFRL